MYSLQKLIVYINFNMCKYLLGWESAGICGVLWDGDAEISEAGLGTLADSALIVLINLSRLLHQKAQSKLGLRFFRDAGRMVRFQGGVRLKYSLYALLGFAVVCLFVFMFVASFLLYFTGPNADSQHLQYFGQVGDFFGGILNPILAFASFIALLYTIKLQSEEMAEARTEMKRSTKAASDLVQIEASNLALREEQLQQKMKQIEFSEINLLVGGSLAKISELISCEFICHMQNGEFIKVGSLQSLVLAEVSRMEPASDINLLLANTAKVGRKIHDDIKRKSQIDGRVYPLIPTIEFSLVQEFLALNLMIVRLNSLGFEGHTKIIKLKISEAAAVIFCTTLQGGRGELDEIIGLQHDSAVMNYFITHGIYRI
jgi:hypothetical protein